MKSVNQRVCAMCKQEPTTSPTAMYGKKCQRLLKSNPLLSGSQKKSASLIHPLGEAK